MPKHTAARALLKYLKVVEEEEEVVVEEEKNLEKAVESRVLSRVKRMI